MMHGTYHLWFFEALILLLVSCHLAADSVETMGEEIEENPIVEALDNGLSDLMKSISTIHDRVKNITKSNIGNFTGEFEEEIENGIGTITKDITYDNLLDKIKEAKNKIKEIQNKVSSAMSHLEENWPESNITRHHP